MSLIRQASRNVVRLHPEPLYRLPPGWFQSVYACFPKLQLRVRVLARRKR